MIYNMSLSFCLCTNITTSTIWIVLLYVYCQYCTYLTYYALHMSNHYSAVTDANINGGVVSTLHILDNN